MVIARNYSSAVVLNHNRLKQTEIKTKDLVKLLFCIVISFTAKAYVNNLRVDISNINKLKTKKRCFYWMLGWKSSKSSRRPRRLQRIHNFTSNFTDLR